MQIKKIYVISALGALRIASASWVALLAMRGFSIVQIGIMESIFHIVSTCCEIPSGVLADVLGRKKTMVASQFMSIFSTVLMLCSDSFFTVSVAIAVSALSYNLSSGTREALAYDSLKKMNREKEYDTFASTEMVLYRICNATATLCAGGALFLGYQKAYTIDLIMELICLVFACRLTEVPATEIPQHENLLSRFRNCIEESIAFLRNHPKAIAIIGINSIIGAVSVLMLFFLQAKLPKLGLETALLGPALFLMEMGAVLGAKAVPHFSSRRYQKVIAFSFLGIIVATLTLLTKNPYIICIGGFIASFSDDFLEVRTDIVLNNMIPSKQRATLISVCSFAFSVVMIFLSPLMGWFMN